MCNRQTSPSLHSEAIKNDAVDCFEYIYKTIPDIEIDMLPTMACYYDSINCLKFLTFNTHATIDCYILSHTIINKNSKCFIFLKSLGIIK